MPKPNHGSWQGAAYQRATVSCLPQPPTPNPTPAAKAPRDLLLTQRPVLRGTYHPMASPGTSPDHPADTASVPPVYCSTQARHGRPARANPSRQQHEGGTGHQQPRHRLKPSRASRYTSLYPLLLSPLRHITGAPRCITHKESSTRRATPRGLSSSPGESPHAASMTKHRRSRQCIAKSPQRTGSPRIDGISEILRPRTCFGPLRHLALPHACAEPV